LRKDVQPVSRNRSIGDQRALTTEWAAPRVGVCAAAASDAPLVRRARELAADLSLPLTAPDDVTCDLLLAVTDEGLELRETGRRAAGGLRADFGTTGAISRRIATASRRQPLARAIGMKRGTPTVVDATAGLGRDALLLANLGCPVVAVERSPVLGEMLRDALERAAAAGQAAAGRVTLIVADAVDVLAVLSTRQRPDTVYIDPMYPATGKSALPKKEMRILRRLVGDDPDAGTLLEAARRVARNRVVVKRPPLAPPLSPGPSVSIASKLTRYDVYLQAE
jgi:16S rRNA (guanine1516-N2)-methyltransferase